MIWPFRRREVRAAAPQGGYAAQILAAAEAAAAGGDAIPAVLGAVVTWYQNLGQVCTTDRAEIDGDHLAVALAQVARRGEAFFLLSGGRAPVCATLVNIRGGPDVESWRYSIQTSGPSRTLTHSDLPASAVLHYRIRTRPGQPWQGVSPLADAGLAPAMAARMERALRDESQVPVSRPIEFGRQLTPEQHRDARSVMRSPTDIAWRDGNLNVIGRDGRGADVGPGSSQLKIGPDVPSANIEARREMSRAIAAAYGIPGALIDVDSNAAGPAQREAFRRFAASTGQALIRMLEGELRRKLGAVRIDMTDLAAADLQVRARAWRSFVDGGMAPEIAARIAGVETGAEQ